jgi:hypothetical protein
MDVEQREHVVSGFAFYSEKDAGLAEQERQKIAVVIIFSRKKSVAVQQRFALVYSSKKQLVPLVEAVAFLMLSFLTGLHSKRFHRNPPAEPFYVSFYTTNSNNVLDQTVVKITVTETVHPGWTG